MTYTISPTLKQDAIDAIYNYCKRRFGSLHESALRTHSVQQFDLAWSTAVSMHTRHLTSTTPKHTSAAGRAAGIPGLSPERRKQLEDRIRDSESRFEDARTAMRAVFDQSHKDALIQAFTSDVGDGPQMSRMLAERIVRECFST